VTHIKVILRVTRILTGSVQQYFRGIRIRSLAWRETIRISEMRGLMACRISSLPKM
jgi:hypothetical protein